MGKEETGTSTTILSPSLHKRTAFALSEWNLDAADSVMQAAADSLNFHIVELWCFVPDIAAGGVLEDGTVPLRPSCLHVFAQPETMDHFQSKLVGVWNKEEKEDARRHVLSPELCERSRQNECPLWFISSDEDSPLHTDLPLKSAVTIPVRLRDEECFVIFLSTTEVKKTRAAMDFLEQMSKAAMLCVSPGLIHSTAPPASEPDTAEVDEDGTEIRTEINSVRAILHAGERLNTDVEWREISDVEFLANGSRCTIYTAEYEKQPCVVKLMRKDVPDAALVRRELEMELELLRRLRHENVVKILGAGTIPERFLITERLEGGTLAQRCGGASQVRDRQRRFKRSKPFNYMDLLRAGRQLAEGLRYLHDVAIPGKTVVHRDIKPDNIGFTKDGDLKLLDMGLSKAIPKSEVHGAVFEMTGETGSTRYMAPEVAEGRPYNEKCDVYSYSMVLWEMATLRKPYEGMSRDVFYSSVVRGHMRPQINKRWPKDFVALLQSCWADDYVQRPSMADVSNSLQEMLQDAMRLDTPKTQGAQPRRGLFTRLGLSDRTSAWF